MDKYYKQGEKIRGEYTIIKELGEGRYGIAYLAKNDKKEKVVVKQLKKKMLKETREKLFYEQKILQSLDNQSFPSFFGKFKDKYREGYILEYFEGTDFEELIVRERCRFTKEDIYHIASQLIDLIEILHKNNIVHRDIRLPNVIVKKDMELSIIDFGLARFIDNKKYVPQLDYWYLGDFLIHLYYTSYKNSDDEDKPWFDELDLNESEKIFLKRLMGLEEEYSNLNDIREQLEKIINNK